MVTPAPEGMLMPEVGMPVPAKTRSLEIKSMDARRLSFRSAVSVTISLLRRASVNAPTAAAMSTRLMPIATKNSTMVKPVCFLKIGSFFVSGKGRNVTDKCLALLPAYSHVAHDHRNLSQIQERLTGIINNRGDLDLSRHA